MSILKTKIHFVNKIVKEQKNEKNTMKSCTSLNLSKKMHLKK